TVVFIPMRSTATMAVKILVRLAGARAARAFDCQRNRPVSRLTSATSWAATAGTGIGCAVATGRGRRVGAGDGVAVGAGTADGIRSGRRSSCRRGIVHCSMLGGYTGRAVLMVG